MMPVKPSAKKSLLLLGAALSTLSVFSQGLANKWDINGNTNITSTANFLGHNNAFPLNLKTIANQPMQFFTNNTQRLYIDNTNGGILGNVGIGSMFSTAFRPVSNLHIQQDNNHFQFAALRDWMSPGAPSTYANTTGTGMLISNGDNVWLGLRHKGVWDANDAVLAWGDNGGPGTDYFRFVLNHWNVGGSPGGTNDGLEIMRFDPTSSFVGIGDYQINNQMTPRSKLHIHEDISLHPGGGTGQSVWFQMTNHDFAPTPTANDGLRMGLLYQSNLLQTGNAFIYNQENRHLIFSTNHATPDATGINTTNERMRITSIGAPTTLAAGYNVYNPGAIGNTDLTRIAFSHNPSAPVTRPLSLLHLGYNAPDANGSGIDVSGWRPWMDVGTFTNYPASFLGETGVSMYNGIKINPWNATDGYTSDAIVSWGYTPSTSATQLKTRMRFLFTTNSNGGTTAAGSNGIEAAHFWSDGNNTRMGVGDMQTANVDPQNTLEIRSSTLSTGFGTVNGSSGLRFTNLKSTNTPIINPTIGVLSVNSDGDVILVRDQVGAGGGTGITQAQNGLSINATNPNAVELGGPLGGAGAAIVTGDREVPMNTKGLFFTGAGKIGLNTTSNLAALHVNQTNNISVHPNSPGSGGIVGVLGSMHSTHSGGNIGVMGDINNTVTSAGCGVFGRSASNTGGSNKGVLGIAIGGTNSINSGYQAGVQGEAFSANAFFNYGGYFAAGNSPTRNWALRADAPAATTGGADNLAGAFFGSILVNGNAAINGNITGVGTDTHTSDIMFKTNIDSITNATSIISQLKPKQFYFDTTNIYGLNFDGRKQYGFVAQDVETVLPELIESTTKRPDIDTVGNIITPAVTFKTMNYDALFAIMLKGMQEQNQKISELQNMLNSCCQNQNSRAQTPGNVSAMDVELSDKDIVVLNQNTPNPFAEQTTITYTIPEKAGFAQIIFNDMKGQIIKVVDVKSKGKGQLNVFANDLSTGMYTYSLYVDGKLIDTKKMVKTE